MPRGRGDPLAGPQGAKTWRLAADVRRSGRYKSGQPIPRSQRVAARAFGAVEALATRAWPVGEELVLTARRPA